MAGREGGGVAAADLLPLAIFADPVLTALGSTHCSLAHSAGDAVRYMAEVAPFAALRTPSVAALVDLATLVAPGESVWVFGEESLPGIPELQRGRSLPCLQMVFPRDAALPEGADAIEPLSLADTDAMLVLIGLAYPGFFRRRTPEMGRYFGIWQDGRLVAMGGERFRMPGYAEISGLCTHPEHRGKGHAARLLGHVARLHRTEDVVSFLHVSTSNRNAIALYERLGMEAARSLAIHDMHRRP